MPSSSHRDAARPRVSVAAYLLSTMRWIGEEVRFGLRLLRWWVVWPGLLLIVSLSVLAYQLPGTYVVDVGSPQDQAYTRNFHARLEEPGGTYRWSDVYGYVSFPGMGGARPFTLTITLDAQRRAPIEVHVNGVRFFAGEVVPGWQELSFRIDESQPAALASRDTVVEFRAPDYRLPGEEAQAKGLKVDRVVLEQSSGGGFIWPSLATLGFLVLSTLLAYILVGRTLRGLSTGPATRIRALVAGTIVGAGLCLLLASSHTSASVTAPHIAISLGSMLLIFVVVERLVGSRTRGDGQRGRLLSMAVALAFGLRYGGMALPQSVIIDMPYHMKWLRTLLAGDWQALYFPGGLSEVPPEWGMSLLIPKSPLFYLAASPIVALPFDLETLLKWSICLLDATVVLFAYWFTRRIGGSKAAALAAAFLYAVMPLAFRAFSYGILPTIFAQWLAAGLLALLLAASVRGWRPATLLAAVVLATLTLLSFPTVAVFVTFVVIVAPVGWRFVRPARNGPQPFSWQPYLVLAVGWLLAFIAYYGLYVTPVAASAVALLGAASGAAATVRWPGGVAELLVWTGDYLASMVPLLLAVVGVLLLLARQRLGVAQARATTLVIAWLAILPVFIAANYKIDMIGKHLFFTMLPVAVAGGVGLVALGGRGTWGGRFAGLLLGTVAWQALVFWVERLVRAST
ncbi:MAG: hypothetical protein M3437_03520 [Chloroflexota bacterium]|nr:hypothetical protein [Chloroflexota bacterium]MDQ5866013.1 hypothetical protein [Chloroflexota bacterium]